MTPSNWGTRADPSAVDCYSIKGQKKRNTWQQIAAAPSAVRKGGLVSRRASRVCRSGIVTPNVRRSIGRSIRTKDLNYINFQKKMLELFFATPGRFDKKDKHGNVKLNTDGKAMECGFVHRRKHCDYLKYGWKLANGSFCSEIQNSMPNKSKDLLISMQS